MNWRNCKYLKGKIKARNHENLCYSDLGMGVCGHGRNEESNTSK